MYWLKLAGRFFGRDVRRGELTIVFLSLLLAVTLISSINFFTQQIFAGTKQQINSLVGGDYIIESTQPISKSLLSTAKDFHLESTTSVTFSSMLSTEENFALANVKAVQSSYPLRGNLITEPKNANTIPAPGEIWLSPRLLMSLNLKVGDSLTLGKTELHISKIIVNEPDVSNDWFNIAPTAMINYQDLAKTGTLTNMSRAFYHWFLAGRPEAINSFAHFIQPQLNSHQRVLLLEAKISGLQKVLNKIANYLTLVSLFIVILAGIAIGLATRRYCQRHYDYTALMRCIGVSQSKIITLYSLIFCYIAFIASGIGCMLGFAAQWLLRSILQDFIPTNATSFTFSPFWLGMAFGFTLLFAFGLPPLIAMKHTPPLRVLRQELAPAATSNILNYSFILVPLFLFLFWQVGNVAIVLKFLLISVTLLLTLWLIIRLLLGLMTYFAYKTPFVIRYALKNCFRHKNSCIIQIIAFSLTITTLLSVMLLRNDVVLQWQYELPSQTPNYFIFNLLPNDYSTFQNWLKEKNITASEIYPVVRGNLIATNGEIASSKRSKIQSLREDSQPLRNLSWTTSLPLNNVIVDGRWWQPEDIGQSLVSIEKDFAERFNIHLNDRITLQIAQQTLHAKVISIRQVEWDTFTPNFSLLFPPGVLDDFSATYIASFYLPTDEVSLIREMISDFPTISVIDISNTLQNLQNLINNLSYLLQYLVWFAMLAGFLVLIASLKISWSERIYETTLLRTIGANNRQIISITSIEYLFLGFTAAAIGSSLALLLVYSVSHFWFKIPYHFPLVNSTAVVLATIFLMVLTGVMGAKNIIKAPPMRTLRG